MYMYQGWLIIVLEPSYPVHIDWNYYFIDNLDIAIKHVISASPRIL